VLALLKAHFPKIELVQDFNEAAARGKKAICLLDLRTVVGRGSFQKTTVDISAYFFDSKYQPVTRISAHGEGTVPFPAFDMRVQASTNAAVNELEHKFAVLLH